MSREPETKAVILRTISGVSRFHTVESVATTGSTNADVAALARGGAAEGYVLVSDEQTAGRGRRTRTWASPAGGSVAMSVLLRPGSAAEGWGWLSLLAGMAVTRGLRTLTGAGPRISLKWPNDVLIDGLKVCGILSECIESPQGPAAVVGIGINLALTREQLPVPHATSLALAGLPQERDAVVTAVLAALDRLYGEWIHTGPPVPEYRELCASIGAPLTITVSEDECFSGVGVGIDRQGRLVVDIAGQRRAFAVGDVVHARLGQPAGGA
ncbi:MAG: biotin--[acetyl-CoA-carboxylase] ligase [Propionibacteriaceae bacterium]|nr:biotin--[acetyl-CoA-carboxylase] ligase [Propionibacteriaceae bacterium]